MSLTFAWINGIENFVYIVYPECFNMPLSHNQLYHTDFATTVP